MKRDWPYLRWAGPFSIGVYPMMSHREYIIWFRTFNDPSINSKPYWNTYKETMKKAGWKIGNNVGAPGITKWIKEENDMKYWPVMDGCNCSMCMEARAPQAKAPAAINSLANLTTAPKKAKGLFGTPPTIMENDMAYGNKNVDIQLDIRQQPATDTSADKSKSYLMSELRQAGYNKADKLESDFRLYANTQPKTFEQLVDWIKSDKFEIDKKAQKQLATAKAEGEDEGDDDGFYWGRGPLYGLTFTAKPGPDRDGYQAAYKALQTEKTKTERIIQVMPAEQGLEALIAFEAWQPTKADTTAQ